MIMLYPSCIIISHVGPSIWLPACEVSEQYFSKVCLSETLTACLGHLGYFDLLFIYSHECKAGKDRQCKSLQLVKLTVLCLGLWPTFSYRVFRRRNLARIFYHHQVNTSIHLKSHACWLCNLANGTCLMKWLSEWAFTTLRNPSGRCCLVRCKVHYQLIWKVRLVEPAGDGHSLST